jgi:hypothetical protein
MFQEKEDTGSLQFKISVWGNDELIYEASSNITDTKENEWTGTNTKSINSISDTSVDVWLLLFWIIFVELLPVKYSCYNKI